MTDDKHQDDNDIMHLVHQVVADAQMQLRIKARLRFMLVEANAVNVTRERQEEVLDDLYRYGALLSAPLFPVKIASVWHMAEVTM